MNKSDLMEAIRDIDNAVEISKATLVTVQEDVEEERVSWVLIGVIDQMDKIQKTLEIIDSAIKDSVI